MVLQDRAKATRGAIIAGAATVFAEHGYGNTSLAQISATAGVTKGALYFHFQSKEDVARAVVEEQHRFVQVATDAVLDENLPALNTMILMCRSFGLQLVSEIIVGAGVRLTFEATAFGQPVAHPYQEWIALFEKLVDRSKAEDQIRPNVDSGGLAQYLVASFTGVQMLSDVLCGRADVMKRIEEMWAILLPGIMHDDFHEDPKSLSELVFMGM